MLYDHNYSFSNRRETSWSRWFGFDELMDWILGFPLGHLWGDYTIKIECKETGMVYDSEEFIDLVNAVSILIHGE